MNYFHRWCMRQALAWKTRWQQLQQQHYCTSAIRLRHQLQRISDLSLFTSIYLTHRLPFPPSSCISPWPCQQRRLIRSLIESRSRRILTPRCTIKRQHLYHLTILLPARGRKSRIDCGISQMAQSWQWIIIVIVVLNVRGKKRFERFYSMNVFFSFSDFWNFSFLQPIKICCYYYYFLAHWYFIPRGVKTKQIG